MPQLSYLDFHKYLAEQSEHFHTNITWNEDKYPYHTQARLALAIHHIFHDNPRRDIILTIIGQCFTHTNLLVQASEIFTMVTEACLNY